MPDHGECLGEENERRLETASYRDLPANNHGAQLLEQSLPPQQQQHHHQSGGRRMAGGIMRHANYRGWTVNIGAPKWKDNQLWISSEDLEAAQYIADAAFYFTGRPPIYFPHAKFDYLPLRLSTGERLTTREKCAAYVAKIAMDPALLERRKDFKERAQKLILEMVKTPEAVRFLSTARTSPRQAWQLRPEPNPEDTDSPFTNSENGMATDTDTSREDAIEAFPSTVTLDPFQYGSLVPVADTHSVTAEDGEPVAPIEIDRLSVEALTSCCTDVDELTAYIPSFKLGSNESLTSAGQRLGMRLHRPGEKDEDLVLDNLKGLLVSLDKGSKGSPLPESESDEKFTGDETGDVVLDGNSHSQCLEFLNREGPNFLMKNLKDRETICSVLLTMADSVKVLPPANEPLPTDLLNMTLWKASLRELVGEMKTVEENFPSLIGNSGVYVLTSSPFAVFLRALAAEIADMRS